MATVRDVFARGAHHAERRAGTSSGARRVLWRAAHRSWRCRRHVGLLLPLLAMDLKPGDEVIVPSPRSSLRLPPSTTGAHRFWPIAGAIT